MILLTLNLAILLAICGCGLKMKKKNGGKSSKSKKSKELKGAHKLRQGPIINGNSSVVPNPSQSGVPSNIPDNKSLPYDPRLVVTMEYHTFLVMHNQSGSSRQKIFDLIPRKTGAYIVVISENSPHLSNYPADVLMPVSQDTLVSVERSKDICNDDDVPSNKEFHSSWLIKGIKFELGKGGCCGISNIRISTSPRAENLVISRPFATLEVKPPRPEPSCVVGGGDVCG